MVSPSVGWMNHWRDMYVTADGWQSWELANYHTGDAHMTPDERLWATAIASRGIAYSDDLGRTWTPSPVAAALPEDFTLHRGLSALAFAPDGRGWAVGAFGVVLATESGEPWTREPTPTDARLLDVQYVDGVVYATGEDGVVLKREATVTDVSATGRSATTWARVKESR